MRFKVLACDYDDTLASNGSVSADTVAALEKLKAAGMNIVLVTGRELEDLQNAFGSLSAFHQIVLENGAVLYDPAKQRCTRLGDPPPLPFVEMLKRRGVNPLSVGQVVVATREPHDQIVRKTIDEMDLDLRIVMNKGGVMVLPSGVDKASGLKEALKELGYSFSAVAGVGDAENDLTFLKRCGYSAAVANALDSVKQEVGLVLTKERGEGVIEFAEQLLKN